MNPFTILSDLANKLDKSGLYQEADILDTILIKEASKNSLIRALKDDNVLAARKALVGMSGEDLGLTSKEFTELTNAIQMGDKELMDPNRPKDKPLINMDKAREILGVGKNVKLDPLTHSPLTGQPWSSGPAPRINNQLHKELLQLKSIIEPHRGKVAGRYSIYVLPPEDYIGVDASLAFKPDGLVMGLEQAGYKKHVPDGETASRSKMVGKDRIVVDVDIGGTAIPTDISVSPMTKENYEAVVSVFGNKSREKTFDSAVKEFEDYTNQPDPTVP